MLLYQTSCRYEVGVKAVEVQGVRASVRGSSVRGHDLAEDRRPKCGQRRPAAPTILAHLPSEWLSARSQLKIFAGITTSQPGPP